MKSKGRQIKTHKTFGKQNHDDEKRQLQTWWFDILYKWKCDFFWNTCMWRVWKPKTPVWCWKTNCGIRASPWNPKPRLIRMNKSNTFFQNITPRKSIIFSQSKHLRDCRFCWFSAKNIPTWLESKWILVRSNKKMARTHKKINFVSPTSYTTKNKQIEIDNGKRVDKFLDKLGIFFVKPQEAFKNKC